MGKKIIYELNGNVCVVTPVDESKIDEVIKKDIPIGVPFKVIDSSALPEDRSFRNAWKLSNSNIDIDILKAKEITKDRLRKEREPVLKALDVDYMLATEKKKNTDSIITEKQRLRDLTLEVDKLTTLDELKSIKAVKQI